MYIIYIIQVNLKVKIFNINKIKICEKNYKKNTKKF